MPNPAQEINDYLTSLPDDSRKALERIRQLVRRVLPGAEEGFSYGMPVFKVDSSPVLGYRAAARHCALYPFSGQTIATLADRLSDYEVSRGTIRFSPKQVPPLSLLRLIVSTRLKEAQETGRKNPSEPPKSIVRRPRK